MPRPVHLLFEWLLIVDGFFLLRVASERHGDAFANQFRSPLSRGARHEVERSELILFPPTPPVGQLRHPTLDVGLRDGVGVGWQEYNGRAD